MCKRLGELREALGRYAAGFDAALLNGADASVAVEHAATIEKTAATLKALAAAREAETGTWRLGGDRSPAHHLARTTGTTVGEAAVALDTARRLEALPEVAAAARCGRLSPQQASAIADAAIADPASEGRLVEAARSASLAELREACARAKAASGPDLEERRRRIHRRRCLRTYTDAEGAWNLHLRHNPEVGAALMGALEPMRDRLFGEARAEGRREPSEAYAADALVAAVCGGGEPVKGRARGGAKVIVRVDLPALLRGYPAGGETCEIAGYGPVAISAVRDLIDSGQPFLAAVATDGERVCGVAHLRRRATAAQQTALEWLYPTCAAQGCATVARLEVDHRRDWATSHVTLLELLDRLCHHHHDRKTREGWALVAGHGKRAFVPPDDPRHPRHAHGPPGES